MSSDIYIPLDYVLTHPELFELSTAYNVGIEDAVKELSQDEVDWYWVEQCVTPVLMCKFYLHPHWRFVEIIGNGDQPRSLHVPVGGDFRRWLGVWLEERQIKYEILS